MNDEKIFIDGMICKRHERAPDFVTVNLSLKMKDLIAFAKEHHKEGWLNVQVKQSKGGKYYAELDQFEPKKQEGREPEPAQGGDPFNDDIPFAQFMRGQV
jgi:hypothetical protein